MNIGAVDQLAVSDVPVSSSTRRGFLAALVGAPVLAAAAVALAHRSTGAVARLPLSPQAHPSGAPPAGNLLNNHGFELDEMGTTFTAWVLGVPLADGGEGIPPTL